MHIAIVGTGVAGLGAGYALGAEHDVELFEQSDRLGGHTYTVVHDGRPLDCGFLVHNRETYPHLTRLFGELGVRTRRSEMSFSVDAPGESLVYSSKRPLADSALLVRPSYLALWWEIVRWLRTAKRSLDGGAHDSASLRQYIADEGYSDRFVRQFLVPITAALWSTAPDEVLDFPAAYAIRFFDNHGMLGFRRKEWRTVVGGSHQYVLALRARFGDRIHAGCGVRSIRRTDDGVDVRTADDEVRRFDGVVVATHADQALALLEDADDQEKDLLGAFAYTTNDTVLHTDASFLPRRRTAWSSWNYQETSRTRPTVSYYLNRLQGIDSDTPYLVTLNRADDIDPATILHRVEFDHPRYDLGALAAQARLPELAGRRRTAFAGAYHGNGFHEDGLASGVAAARAFGVHW